MNDCLGPWLVFAVLPVNITAVQYITGTIPDFSRIKIIRIFTATLKAIPVLYGIHVLYR